MKILCINLMQIAANPQRKRIHFPKTIKNTKSYINYYDATFKIFKVFATPILKLCK